MRAAGIVLAAGASRRFGSPKQLALVTGEQLLVRAVRICSEAGLSPVIVVLGANADQIEASCDLSGAIMIRNPAWGLGMASSIRAGVAALDTHHVDAAVITACDMPLVTSAHLRALVALADKEKTSVGSLGNDWTGVPACFHATAFPLLLKLEGDTGARKLLDRAPVVHLKSWADIDTLEDLETVRDFSLKRKPRAS